MSDGNGTCEYVLDPDDPETWGGEEGEECLLDEKLLNGDGVWTCPHDSEEGEDLCIFHQPVEEKDDEEAVKTFIDLLDEATEEDSDSSEQLLQFVGGRFGEFDLSENPPELVAKDAEIVLSNSTFEGKLNWSETVFEVSVMRMRSIECISNSIFSSAKFGGVANFSFAEFGDGANFDSAEFGDGANFSFAEFGDGAIFSFAKFGDRTNFDSAEFGDKANFFLQNSMTGQTFLCRVR